MHKTIIIYVLFQQMSLEHLTITKVLTITNDNEDSFIPYSIKQKQAIGIISMIQLKNIIPPRRDITTSAKIHHRHRGGTALPPRRDSITTAERQTFTEDKTEKIIERGANSYIISIFYARKVIYSLVY